MIVHTHRKQKLETWRPGVVTEMRTSFLTGSRQLCIFDQFCDPGLGAPLHVHAVEEVLEVFAGTAEVRLDDEVATVAAGQSVLVPAGARHGFRNVGTDTLHVRATLASPIFEAGYDGTRETTRRWSPG